MIVIRSYGYINPNIYSVDVFTDNALHDAKFIKHIARIKGAKLRIITREREKITYTLEFENKEVADNCAKFIKKCHLYKID